MPGKQLPITHQLAAAGRQRDTNHNGMPLAWTRRPGFRTSQTWTEDQCTPEESILLSGSVWGSSCRIRTCTERSRVTCPNRLLRLQRGKVLGTQRVFDFLLLWYDGQVWTFEAERPGGVGQALEEGS